MLCILKQHPHPRKIPLIFWLNGEESPILGGGILIMYPTIPPPRHDPPPPCSSNAPTPPVLIAPLMTHSPTILSDHTDVLLPFRNSSFGTRGTKMRNEALLCAQFYGPCKCIWCHGFLAILVYAKKNFDCFIYVRMGFLAFYINYFIWNIFSICVKYRFSHKQQKFLSVLMFLRGKLLFR